MSELTQFETNKKKLEGICDENNLVFRLRADTYPITLTIKPATDVESQMTMLEEVEDKGYISPDASLVFFLMDGAIGYKTSSNFTISETLFNKLKNLFKKLYGFWLMFFFRDVVQNSKLRPGDMPVAKDDGVDEMVDHADEPDEEE